MTRWAADVSPARVHPEYPRPQLVRERWLSLNGLWELDLGAAEADPPPVGRTLPRTVLVPFPVESALSGVMEHAKRLWYRRLFEVPRAWRGGRVLLHFGAVDWEARVWVNGAFVGEHRGGYDGFTVDVTGALRDGAGQELVVGVFDPTDAGTQPRGKQVLRPEGIWYTPSSGIWQTVWIEPVAGRRIDRMRIIPDADRGTVRVEAILAGPPGGADLEVVVRAAERAVARASGPGPLEVTIPSPRLWSPDDPFLYDLEVSLHDPREPRRLLDRVGSYFGLRSIDVGPDDGGTPRLRLNGRPLFHIGTLDQGFWPDGLYTPPTDEARRFDVEITRSLGFNAIRKHVKVEPERWYHWCDRLGVLVWQDMPSGDATAGDGRSEIERSEGSAATFERELAAMVEGRFNHPSIAVWVLFNEGWGQYDTKRLTELIRRIDPTRPVDSASGWHDLGTGDIHDVHRYPGPAAPPPEPRRAAVLGEFGGLGLPVEGHTWSRSAAWGYRDLADVVALERQYEGLLRRVRELERERGLAAAFYTQITDVETECNGLLTYDRGVIKPRAARVADANRGRLPRLVRVVGSAQAGAHVWRYTCTPPPEGWEQPGFDDASWEEGAAGFGAESTPGAIVRTAWTGPGIWLRRRFTIDGPVPEGLLLEIHHDEDAEVWLNGVPAASADGYTTDYEEVEIAPAAAAALRPGENLVAVRCRQTAGGQYIDLGLVRLEGPP